LDRNLIEQIGPLGRTSFYLEKIKSLVESGATPDHWVENYGRQNNAIQLASKNKNEQANPTLEYLLFKFTNFVNKEEGFASPLSFALWSGNLKKTKFILKKKISINPIYCCMKWFVRKLTDEEKMEIISQIEEIYDLKKIIKDDLKQIGDEREFGNGNVRQNIPILFNYLQSKSPKLISEYFGKSNNINEPLTWRFEKANKFHWVAEEMQKRYKNGKISIENNEDIIKVKIS